jgi:PTH1 family peptidyl-tRNA hydrolase
MFQIVSLRVLNENQTYCFVGLGNPGRGHIYDRHNMGFMIIDYMPNKFNFQNRDFSIERKIAGREIHFLKPLTYMNLSGLSVKQ